MTHNKQKIAQMRASQIRNILGSYQQLRRLLDDPRDEMTLRHLVDKMLKYRDAETITERNIRRQNFSANLVVFNDEKAWKEFHKPWGGKKSYKLTDEDIHKYTHW